MISVAIIFVLGTAGTLTNDTLINILIQIVIVAGIPLILYSLFVSKNPKTTLKDFGFKKLSGKLFLLSCIIALILFVLNIFVSSCFSSILYLFGYEQTIPLLNVGYGEMFKDFFFTACLPGVCEEILHRGMMLNASKKYGYTRYGLIISSLLFGLMHLNIQQFFYATILGLLMGFLVSMTRSIWPSIIIHFCNNFINVYFTFAETNNLPGAEFTNILNSLASKNIFMFIILSITIVAVCVIGIIFLVKRLFVETSINSYGKVFEDIENKIRGDENNSMTDQEVLGAFNEVVFPNMKSPKNLFDFFVADTKKYDKLALKYKIPLIACLFLGVVITLFTFIWGCV